MGGQFWSKAAVSDVTSDSTWHLCAGVYASKRQSGPRVRRHSFTGYSATLRNRSAFEMTETELNVMAALAKMGVRSKPMNG